MKYSNFKILIVDDEEEYLEVLSLILHSKGYKIETAFSGKEALELLMKKHFDLVLSDLIMDKMTGMELLKKIKSLNIPVDFIMVTGYGSINNAVEAIKNGAFSYFIKGADPQELVDEITKLATIKSVPKINEMDFNQPLLTTRNTGVQNVLSILNKVSGTDISILLTGESGVGKEVYAKYIHDYSQRKTNPFVPVNCAALSSSLLESELFGHEKGAYTGAGERRIGRFEEANKGTLFLDEIGEINNDIQVKLLRVLEGRTIERVGSNGEIPVDIRLITATNKNLATGIQTGDFRKDLFYRINAISVEIPPLRFRNEDILPFFDYFVNKFQQKYQKSINGVEDSIKQFLKNYKFPGNIRELRNIVERLVILSDNGLLRGEDLPETFMSEVESAIAIDKSPGSQSLKELRKEVEKNYITLVLETYNSDLFKTAEHLDITKRQLFNKIKEFGIKY
ncbi:sigma-54-dependent transcriptional regulator [Bacillus sp. 1NLA3E]|uniref:sigma-54-dependent transcriptional regulator n=1 Tax=Bacillus sp. 1NLA3E TaxID=666686 RepID=UPI000247EDCD|nr:sigma-54 dependent transcriptional regulator [Bacillus sp. 1NLA3E]AGK53713.1 two-component response regulator [Bacillus sp. 1NLA3E]